MVDTLATQGITSAFKIQAITIADALEGRDICGKAKTGSGKTLAFGLPLLMRTERAESNRPRSLVLVPTRELAAQVCDVLNPLGAAVNLRVEAFYGGTNLDRDRTRLDKGVDALVATPGRLIDLVGQDAVSLGDVSLVVIDEADRMADMGFTPQVEWLLRHVKGPAQTLLFSATLDGEVNGLIRRYQTDPVRHEVASPMATVEQMTHRFLKVHEMDKARVLGSIATNSERTIAFCRTKRGCDKLVSILRKECPNLSVAAIHGDLRQQAREKALARFAEGDLELLAATDVAARGIDVEGIDTVVHYDLPEDHKSYLHRSGRTARAGEEGLVVSLVLWNEELIMRRLQKALGLTIPLVEMFSNDKRLADLVAWDPNESM